MKSFGDVRREQQSEVKYLRSLIETVLEKQILRNEKILGVLLTGSVSRGDARVGPFGLFIDFAVVVRNLQDVDLTSLIGPDEKPSFPFHCVTLDGNIGLAVEVVEYVDLLNIRTKDEAAIYAKFESAILMDREGLLKTWKKKTFVISHDDIRKRSVERLLRTGYLIGEYRMEKWEHRQAWAQLNQNLNEACERFCEFLYCINGSFIPRRDWLVYLLFELDKKPAHLEQLIDQMYQADSSQEAVRKRHWSIVQAYEWMQAYGKARGWT